MTQRPDPCVLRDILFLGGQGRVGRLLRARAPGALWQGRRPGPGLLYWQPGMVPPLVRPRAIVALWGVTSGSAQDLAQNSTLALAALDLARRLECPRVLHLSSGAVYGAPASPVRETAPLAPLSPYGQAKAAMEDCVHDWHCAHPVGPRSCLMRLGNVAGADQLAAAMAAGPVWLDRFADGQGPRRSYIAPADLLRVCATLAEARTLPQVLNVAGPRPVAMDAILQAAGHAFRWRPAPSEALAEMALDTGRLAALMGPLSDSGTAQALLRAAPVPA